MNKRRFLLAMPLIALLAAGCGAKNPNAPASVSGMVKYKGQPLKGGTVAFHTKDSGVYKSTIAPDGTYSVADLPVGEHVVTVETESAKPKQQPQYGGGQYKMPEYKPPGAPAEAGKGPDPSLYQKIDSKYANPKTSPLTMTIEKGRQVKDIEVD